MVEKRMDPEEKQAKRLETEDLEMANSQGNDIVLASHASEPMRHSM